MEQRQTAVTAYLKSKQLLLFHLEFNEDVMGMFVVFCGRLRPCER